jgi:hypothetical protein
MKPFQFFIGLLIYMLLVSCTPKTLGKDDLEIFVDDADNGLTHIHEVDDFLLCVQYVPKELLFADELLAQESSFEDQRLALRTALDSLEYFKISFSKSGKPLEFAFAGQGLVEQMAARMEGDVGIVKLEHQGLIVPPYSVFFYPTYGTGAFTTWLVVFKLKLTSSNRFFKLSIDDDLFGTGLNQIQFDTHDVLSVPKLSLSKPTL